MIYTQSIVWALQERARELVQKNGHSLAVWQSAKKKYGVGAMKTLCLACGMGVMIAPKLRYGKIDVSAMKGDALFDRCHSVKNMVDGL